MSKLEWKYRHAVEAEKAPAAVVAARRVIARWEAKQDAKIERYVDKLRAEATLINRNLLFDSVESCLLQVDEFERTT